MGTGVSGPAGTSTGIRANLALFAHPDDEVLGCGGLIARNPQDWHVAVLTDGVSSRKGWTKADLVQRQDAFAAAMKVLGVTSFECLDCADQQLEELGLDLNRLVSDVVERIKPTAVYTHFRGDLNKDHRLVCEAVHVACRPPQRIAIYECEVPSSTEWGIGEPFRPNVFVDLLSMDLARKLSAFACYEAEGRPEPHPRNSDRLARRAEYWGSVSGLFYAEPFMLAREIR